MSEDRDPRETEVVCVYCFVEPNEHGIEGWQETNFGYVCPHCVPAAEEGLETDVGLSAFEELMHVMMPEEQDE